MNDVIPVNPVESLPPLSLSSIVAIGPGQIQVGGWQLGPVAAHDLMARLASAIAESQRMEAEAAKQDPWRDVLARLDAQWAQSRPVSYTHVSSQRKARGMAMLVADGKKRIVLLRTSKWSIARLVRHGPRWVGFIQTASPDLCTPAWSPNGEHFYLDMHIKWSDTKERVSVPHTALSTLPLTDGCGRLINAIEVSP